MSKPTETSAQAPILFFDGVCGLCNEVVDWLLPRSQDWLFSPLQGEAAKSKLPSRLTENLDTVVVLKDGKITTHSDAVIVILETLPRYRSLAKVLKTFPKFLRDIGYRRVAKIRYAVWGKKETCRLPSADERARFLP